MSDFKKLIVNPSKKKLRKMAEKCETTTVFGSPAYISRVRNRLAKLTKNNIDSRFSKNDLKLIQKARELMKEKEMIQIDRFLGQKKRFYCRLYIPSNYARTALLWSELLLKPEKIRKPDFVTYFFPEFPETRILVDAKKFVTYALNTDYAGEAKKSFLRMWMFKAKKQGFLGLHAGSKQLKLKEGTVNQLFFGLSATGKSTLTGHGMFLKGKERAFLVQDDVVGLMPDSSVIGTENKGLYVKTDKLKKDEQPEIYRAVTSSTALLENVMIKKNGVLDLDDESLTSNGRATIQRSEMHNSSKSIDLEQVNQLFFITRNNLMPPISRLSREQGVIAFMLGESVESSAGDPANAGKAVRVVGTNPFIIGDPGKEGNLLHSILKKNSLIECFILNTGWVGNQKKSFHNITVRETVSFVLAATRKKIEWVKPNYFDFEVPKNHVGSVYDPITHFGEKTYLKLHKKQKIERVKWLKKFKSLDKRLLKQVY